MLHRLQAISALLVAVALFTGANGLTTTLLAIQGKAAGFTPGVIGMLASAYFAGFIVACVVAGRIVRRVGHIRAYAGVTAIMAISVLAYPFVVHPLAWIALRSISGFCHAVLTMTAESWLNAVSSADERGRLFSAYRIVDLGSVTLAQLTLTLFDPLAAVAFSIIAMSVIAAVVPVTLTRIHAPGEITQARLDVRALLRLSPLGVAGVVAVGFVSGALWGTAPIYVTEAGFAPPVVGWFISAAIVGGALSQWPLGRYSDRHDRRKVIVGASAVATLAALAMFVMAILGRPPLLALIAGAACLGGAALPIYSLAISHANDRADAGEFVRIASGLILFFGIGAVLGPALSAAVVRVAGPASLFACLAVVCATLCAFAFVRTRYSDAPASKEDFVMLSRSSPAAFELDPRAAAPAPRPGAEPAPASGPPSNAAGTP